jgi:hypothetical protein
MTFRSLHVLAAIALAFASARPVLAQSTPRERVALTIGVSQQATSTTFTQSMTFEAYSEDGSITTSTPIGQKLRFDAGGIVRVWRGFGVGVAGTAMSGTDTAQIDGQVPHPIERNQPRPLSGTADVFHRESAIHVQAAYWFQPSPRVDVLVSAGPSLLHVEQDFVSDVSYSQVFPYDSVTFQSATLTREQKSVVGFNAGGQIGVRIVNHVGVAGLVRYSHATASFPDTGATSLKLGGLELGGGLHLTF